MGKRKNGRVRQKLRMPVKELDAVFSDSIYGEPANWNDLTYAEQDAWIAANPSPYDLVEVEEKRGDLDRGTELFRVIIRRVADGRLFATKGGSDVNENWFGDYSQYDAAEDAVVLEEVFEETVTKIVYV